MNQRKVCFAAFNFSTKYQIETNKKLHAQASSKTVKQFQLQCVCHNETVTIKLISSQKQKLNTFSNHKKVPAFVFFLLRTILSSKLQLHTCTICEASYMQFIGFDVPALSCQLHLCCQAL